MWGACTQSHEWAWLCDKLSVSWLLIIPCCLFPNTVLAVKHLIYWKKELVFDPTCRTSAGNRFLTPSRIFLLSVVQQKPTNPILAGFGWRGTGETISNLQIEHVHEQWWGKLATWKTWKTGQRKMFPSLQTFRLFQPSGISPHSVKSVWRQRVEVVVIGFIFKHEGRLFVALTDEICHRIGWRLR